MVYLADQMERQVPWLVQNLRRYLLRRVKPVPVFLGFGIRQQYVGVPARDYPEKSGPPYHLSYVVGLHLVPSPVDSDYDHPPSRHVDAPSQSRGRYDDPEVLVPLEPFLQVYPLLLVEIGVVELRVDRVGLQSLRHQLARPLRVDEN